MVYVNDQPFCELPYHSRVSIKVFTEGIKTFSVKFIPTKKYTEAIIATWFYDGPSYDIDVHNGRTYFLNVDTYQWDQWKPNSVHNLISTPQSEELFKNDKEFKKNPIITEYQEDMKNPFILKISSPLSMDDVIQIKNELQLLFVPFNLNELKAFILKPNDFISEAKPRPNTSLFTRYSAYGEKFVVTTSISGMSANDFFFDVIPQTLMPIEKYNPQQLFSLYNPLKEVTDNNKLGFKEIKIYETNDKVKDHLLFLLGNWYRITE